MYYDKSDEESGIRKEELLPLSPVPGEGLEVVEGGLVVRGRGRPGWRRLRGAGGGGVGGRGGARERMTWR